MASVHKALAASCFSLPPSARLSVIFGNMEIRHGAAAAAAAAGEGGVEGVQCCIVMATARYPEDVKGESQISK